MPWIPTYDEAYALLEQYNQEPFHLTHAKVVSGVLRIFAREIDPGREAYWAVVGLLHDLDFERYPDQHCVAVRALLEPLDVDPALVGAIVSHGWGLTEATAEPLLPMEKVLFAVDELTGLIGAAARMRPSGSVQDMELKSLQKKFKSPAFAAGCSRETIQLGADRLGWPLETLMEKTLEAMRELEREGA
ncbi:hydrolase [Clostridia bacterium]|nr:hydrolase [Clostridia bacterium]